MGSEKANPFEEIHDRFDHLNHLVSTVLDRLPQQNLEGIRKEYLSVEELSKELDLSKQTIYNLVNKRKIPYFKKTRRLLFNRSEISDWLMEGQKKSHD